MGTTLLMACGAITLTAAAQKGLQLGPKVIPSWAWFLNDNDEAAAGSGLAYGFGVNYHFKESTGAGIDLIWSKDRQVIMRDGEKWEHELTFLKVPVLLHFSSGSTDKVPFLGYFGLEYVSLRKAHLLLNGRNVDQQAFFDQNGVPIATLEPEDLFRANNIGIVLGLGPGWNISERFQFTAIVRAEYLVHDPENKDRAFYWGTDRLDTHLITLGIDLGIRVIIPTSGS